MSTTMQFGPEWMRPKAPQAAPSRSLSSTRDPSPPPAPPGQVSGHGAPGTTYSALTASAPPPASRDGGAPFRYTREEMLRIYKDTGARGVLAPPLGAALERWADVVRDAPSEPMGLKPLSDAEKKLFAGPLNSELRRRQSVDYLSPLATPSLDGGRPKLYHQSSGMRSPMTNRFDGEARGILGRREQPSLTIPRKLSVSSLSGGLNSPREGGLPSPRTRGGLTPGGFDGVLSSGGESWHSRRRVSDATKPSGLGLGRVGDEGGGEGLGIKEEPDEDLKSPDAKVGDKPATDQTQAAVQAQPLEPPGSVGQNLAQGIGQLSLKGDASSGAGYPLAKNIVNPTPVDLAAVEWSYIDPQGVQQGPFRADIMQSWHEAGFFTQDLLMKRTELDSTWTPFGDMLKRATTSQIFMLPAPPPVPAEPPNALGGLGLGTVRRPVNDLSMASPIQPIPARPIRGNTFDGLTNHLHTPTDSPASSFTGGRFANGSPDPLAFGGRPFANAADPVIASRFNGSGGTPDLASPFRRNTYGDTPDAGYGLPSAFNGATGSPAVGGFGMNGDYGAAIRGSPLVSHTAISHSPSMAYAQPSSFEARQPSLLNMGRPESVLSNNASMLSSARGNFAGGPMTPSAQYAAQSPFSAGGIGAGFGGGRDGVHSQFAGVPPHPHSPQPSAPPAHQPSPIVPAAVQSPWGLPEPIGARRVAQFEAPHPKVSNVTLAEPLPPKPQQPSIHTQARAAPSEAPAAPAASTPGAGRKAQQQSPWFAATNGVVQEGWGEPPTTNSLTFSNLVQHNQQHEQAATVGAVPPASVPAPVPEALAPSAPAPAPAPEPAQAAPAQARRKSGAPTKAPVLEPAPATHETILDVESPATPGATKTPWLVQEDKKPKPSGVSLGFREIQELEAKQTQARKAADKERVARAAAVAAVAVAVSPAEEAAPVKTTWGLPTSQTTVRTTPTAAATAAAAAVAAAAAAPVWTNAAKPQSASKKTMKEIQEEEERRKKQAAKEKETAAAAARRAYADSTAKPAAVPAQPAATVGGAWSTVKTGKPAPIAAPARPALASASSIASSPVARVANGMARATPSPAPATRPVPQAIPKADDFPAPPSQDFMRWLSDALKGLNNSVNYEDIASILLQFPADGDASTAEIISDLIYANSTTLDGRRFASDFLARRKADNAARPKGTTVTPGAGRTGGGASIADVVRAQPKPAQNEWGGFKVVNKKKKNAKA